MSVEIDGQNYTESTTSGTIIIYIASIPTEEKPLKIEFTAQGMQKYTKTVRVKKIFRDATDLEVFF